MDGEGRWPGGRRGADWSMCELSDMVTAFGGAAKVRS